MQHKRKLVECTLDEVKQFHQSEAKKVVLDLCKKFLCMTSDLHSSLCSYMFCKPPDTKQQSKKQKQVSISERV